MPRRRRRSRTARGQARGAGGQSPVNLAEYPDQMTHESGYSHAVDRALALSSLAHADKTRKGTLIPYVMHPVHVAMILQRYGYGEPLVIAALLHDVIEDTRFGHWPLQAHLAHTFQGADLPMGVPAGTFRQAVLAFIAREFGHEVLDLVQAVTEPKNDGGPERTWRERREHQLAHLEHATTEVAALKAADLLHNIVSVVRDLSRDGPRVMDRFNAAPSESLWYYETAAGLAARRLDRGGFADELLEAVRALRSTLERFGAVPCKRG